MYTKIGGAGQNRSTNFLSALRRLTATAAGCRQLETGSESPELKAAPSSALLQRLNPTDRDRLLEIRREVELISQQNHRLFPQEITDNNWQRLLRCENAGARLQYLRFVRQTEKKREKDERRKAERKAAKQKNNNIGKTESNGSDEYRLVSLSPGRRERMENALIDERHMAISIEPPPSIVLDCRFLPLLSDRGLNLTAIQMDLLLSTNRTRRNPWPIHFVNFNGTDQRVSAACQAHWLTQRANTVSGPSITTANYTDIFEPERLVYLSPDAQEDLDTIKGDEVFIIGAIVDQSPEKGIHPQASLMTAQDDDVLLRRLPIDRYVNWIAGRKYLTLLAVLGILQDVYDTHGDWAYAMRRNVPVRNVRPIEDRNAGIRAKRKFSRQENAQLLETVAEKMKSKSIRVEQEVQNER